MAYYDEDESDKEIEHQGWIYKNRTFSKYGNLLK